MRSRAIRHIFFPTSGEPGEESAFVHALKISQVSKSTLTMMHVARTRRDESWDSFPRVRDALSRWGLIAENAPRSAVDKLGLRVAKVLGTSDDVAGSMSEYLAEHSVDLTVLLTHAYSGIDRFRYPTVAEPLARRSGTSTLFLPPGSEGFVDTESGEVTLARVLIPIAHSPDPTGALEAAADLATTLRVTNCVFDLLWVGEREAKPDIEIPESAEWEWRLNFRTGEVVEEILRTAGDYQSDLIVMATAGHDTFLDALRGNKTERVLREALCPTLMVQKW